MKENLLRLACERKSERVERCVVIKNSHCDLLDHNSLAPDFSLIRNDFVTFFKIFLFLISSLLNSNELFL